jgi:hypothetical protein
LNSILYGNNQRVDYLYDSIDRVSEVQYEGSPYYRYVYDASGNLGYHQWRPAKAWTA